jgi:hypothetical protein
MPREMEVMWNGVKMGRFLFTPTRFVHTQCVACTPGSDRVTVNTATGVNKKRPILTPFHITSISRDMEIP